MPELPEVETMKTALLPHCNQVITKTVVNNINLRKKINSSFIDDITGNSIININRLGKFLLFDLSNNKCLLMHAGMSGKFIIESKSEQLFNKHNHVVFILEDQTKINFNDPRRFGLALTFNNKNLATKYVNLGIDALDPKLSVDYLKNLLKKSSCDIKTFLLNQKAIAGIGNIYASEILFYSKIHPSTVSKSLNEKQIKLLLNEIKKVLLKSVSLGGSTLKDYRKPTGEIGYFQNSFAVYGKNTQKCSNCGNLIEKITQKGRSTYFCPYEQILEHSTKKSLTAN